MIFGVKKKIGGTPCPPVGLFFRFFSPIKTEGLAYADPGARAPIGASGNSSNMFQALAELCQAQFRLELDNGAVARFS
jgi:hypothetical protein